MAIRPLVMAFDVIETLFPLEPLRKRILDAGQPGHVLELWFARLLRDAFTLAASGGYRPFAEIAIGAMASATNNALPDDSARGIVAGIAQLDPHPDALVAAHGWDIHGARQAGLTTGWVSRLEHHFPAVFDPPDVPAADLVGVIEGLLSLPEQ